jgi:TetR/AcrR family transcriptional repressor of nem operon
MICDIQKVKRLREGTGMARASREAKAASRVRIVEEAARLLRERGIGATGVADVMEAAGLTHGGFYRHFSSKDELASEAIDCAIQGFVSSLEEDIGRRGPREAVARYISQYLSPAHVASPGKGCPLAALSEEAPRGAEPCRQALARGASRIASLLEQAMDGDANTAKHRATALLATLIGTVVLARAAVTQTAARDILAAGRRSAEEQLGSTHQS